MVRRLRLAAVTLAAFGLLATGLVASPTTAAESQDRIVGADPVNTTPHVLDGRVLAVAVAGDTVVLGGRFTRVSSPDESRTYDRQNLVAFDRNTGEIHQGFAPETDEDVTSLAVGPDGESVYVGGYFDTVDGQGPRSVARLALSDGSRWPGFEPPEMTGVVRDLQLSGSRLWIAGAFTHLDGSRQPGLATLDAETGAFDPYMDVGLEDPREGVRQVLGIDISPDGEQLVAIGNFTTADGLDRSQAVMLDLTGSDVEVRDWRTDFFTSACSDSFHSYMRDVDFSPDGDYFAIVTTGAYGGGPPESCDTTSRFESDATGTGIEPTWVTYTGGDTLLSVAATGTAVYTGGHNRWQNNPHAADEAGPGAVGRPGLAALDPNSGRPFAWNPTRTLGVGTFDLVATEKGLWTASDTDELGGEYHGRIGFFPLSDGTPVPAPSTATLPTQLYHHTDNGPRRQRFDGTTMGDPSDAPAGGLNWDRMRGAFMLSGQLYAGWRDGGFDQRGFDGEAYGSANPVDTADQLVTDDAWHRQVSAMTGAFFDEGRLYYTTGHDDRLTYRHFTPQSGVVGARRHAAASGTGSLDFSRAAGMALIDGTLYVGDRTDGNLRAVSFANGELSGNVEVISGPDVDGRSWDRSPLFAYAGSTTKPDFVGANVSNGNATQHEVTVPEQVTAGNRMVLFLTLNATDRTVGDPSGVAGWEPLGSETSRSSTTRAWTKVADSDDAGGTVSISVSEWTKGALSVAAYGGADTVVRSWASGQESAWVTSHTTPTLGGVPGSVLVSYWGEKSSGTTTWTRPGEDHVVRSESFGSGGGRVSSLLTENRAPGTGTVGGVTAETDYASSQVQMWSILLGSAE